MWIVLLLVVACMSSVVVAVLLLWWFNKGSGDAYKNLPTTPPTMRLQAMQDAVNWAWKMRSDDCWEFNRWVRMDVMAAYQRTEDQLFVWAKSNPGKPVPGQYWMDRVIANVFMTHKASANLLVKCKGKSYYDGLGGKLPIAESFERYKYMTQTEFHALLSGAFKAAGFSFPSLKILES